MAHAFGRVPIAAKVHPFETEIRGNQQLRTGYNTQNCRIISYSDGKFPGRSKTACLTPDGGNQLSFSSGQAATIYAA